MFSDFGSFETFGENPLESVVIAVFAENGFAGVAPVQGMIQPARFVGP